MKVIRMAENRTDDREDEPISRVQRQGTSSVKSVGDYEDDSDEKEMSVGLSVILWLLRKSIVPIIMIVMLYVGLYVGYVVLGDQPKDEILKWSTWRHLYDLIFAES